MTEPKTPKPIKTPLEFETIYQRFLTEDVLVFNDEIALKEYIEAGDFEATNTFVRKTNPLVSLPGISIKVHSASTNAIEDGAVYYYHDFGNSKKAALAQALFDYLSWSIK